MAHNIICDFTKYQTITVYKVIGDEDCLSDYVRKHSTPTTSDWSGIYFQFSIDHALRSLFYRTDQGYEKMRLVEITFKGLDVFKLTGDIFIDGSVSDVEKSTVVKDTLSIDKQKKLVESVKGALMIEELKNDFELIVPIHMILDNKVSCDEVVLKEYKIEKSLTVYERNLDQPGEWRIVKVK
ncbi:hypothetical protein YASMINEVIRUS_11 [Yasminevirus sp. GU-2018]|uniref:Uncharacterized protein n=1 Tax=Yasminevirus sp. GU-2018 TaxID=2420051 RepID=A0A5K0U6H7_9VIRU|nr:hypothetical protein YASMINEVIRUS_11 [Yasminevirus sp. GU-2018]